MGLEGRDISDAEIMESTQLIAGVNDRIQFKTKLPSGRDLESEFFPADKRKEAMLAWVDVVRQQRVDDAQEVRARAQRVQEEQRRGAIDRPAVLGPDGAPYATQQQLAPYEPSGGMSPGFSTPAVPSSGSLPTATGMQSSLMNPLEYAKSALSSLQQEKQMIQSQLMALMQRATLVDSQIAQWTQILNMTGVTTNGTGQVPSGVQPTAGLADTPTPPVPAKRPRGRPRKHPAGGSILNTDGTKAGT